MRNELIRYSIEAILLGGGAVITALGFWGGIVVMGVGLIGLVLSLLRYRNRQIDRGLRADLTWLQPELITGLQDYMLLVRESDKKAVHKLYLQGLVERVQRSVLADGIVSPQDFWILTSKGREAIRDIENQAK